MTSNLRAQPASKPTRPRRYVIAHPVTPTPVPGLSQLSLPEPAATPDPAAAPVPTRRSRPTATPTPDNFGRLLADVLRLFNEPTATPTDGPRLVLLPTIVPTPTSTATFIPTPAPLPTETPTLTLVMPTPLPPPILAPTPLLLPTEAPPVEEPPFALPVNPPPPAPAPTEVASSTFSSPVNPAVQPSPAARPAPADSGYDFLLAEFYNSPTTNAFLVIYVAIVDPNEIPIGDIKVVGARLDHNLTYESPLSTWHFEGYNAPGEVIKSGNVKFEPPSGMETTNWVLHLEDPSGKRLSEDVPFNTDTNNKQWYFIKFKRKP
ncbi:MAG: hypothetical protein U0401_35370 [Anaerolineae bacterium]